MVGASITKRLTADRLTRERLTRDRLTAERLKADAFTRKRLMTDRPRTRPTTDWLKRDSLTTDRSTVVRSTPVVRSDDSKVLDQEAQDMGRASIPMRPAGNVVPFAIGSSSGGVSELLAWLAGEHTQRLNVTATSTIPKDPSCLSAFKNLNRIDKPHPGLQPIRSYASVGILRVPWLEQALIGEMCGILAPCVVGILGEDRDLVTGDTFPFLFALHGGGISPSLAVLANRRFQDLERGIGRHQVTEGFHAVGKISEDLFERE